MEPLPIISVSQVNAYLACPLKYRFQYVDKIPRPWRVAAMAFGSSVHAAVEWFHKERLADRRPDLVEVLKVFDADWYAQNVEPLVFSERALAFAQWLVGPRGQSFIGAFKVNGHTIFTPDGTGDC